MATLTGVMGLAFLAFCMVSSSTWMVVVALCSYYAIVRALCSQKFPPE